MCVCVCVCLRRANVTLKPNPEEIDAVKYVTLSELQAMMDPRTGTQTHTHTHTHTEHLAGTQPRPCSGFGVWRSGLVCAR